MPYHVSIELVSKDVLDLKRSALDKETTVKSLVRDLVTEFLFDWRSAKSVADSGRREKVSVKRKS